MNLYQLFIFCAVCGTVLARPNPQIIRQFFENLEFGGFRYGYETADGTKVGQVGEIINPGTDNEILVISGFFSYVSDDNKTYEVIYQADENGFQPEGDHIPPSAGVKTPTGPKTAIGPCVIATLCGGNAMPTA